MDQDERRQGRRFFCQFPAQLLILFPETPLNPFSALVLVCDISIEGVRALCPRPSEKMIERFREGRVARLYLHNGSERAMVPTTIRWVKSNDKLYRSSALEIGLSFDKSKPSTMLQIEQFLQKGLQRHQQHDYSTTGGFGI